MMADLRERARELIAGALNDRHYGRTHESVVAEYTDHLATFAAARIAEELERMARELGGARFVTTDSIHAWLKGEAARWRGGER